MCFLWVFCLFVFKLLYLFVLWDGTKVQVQQGVCVGVCLPGKTHEVIKTFYYFLITL